LFSILVMFSAIREAIREDNILIILTLISMSVFIINHTTGEIKVQTPSSS
jgi:hypothetical protein